MVLYDQLAFHMMKKGLELYPTTIKASEEIRRKATTSSQFKDDSLNIANTLDGTSYAESLESILHSARKLFECLEYDALYRSMYYMLHNADHTLTPRPMRFEMSHTQIETVIFICDDSFMDQFEKTGKEPLLSVIEFVFTTYVNKGGTLLASEQQVRKTMADWKAKTSTKTTTYRGSRPKRRSKGGNRSKRRRSRR